MKSANGSMDYNSFLKQALESFMSKVKQDEQVIAVILMGSLSYDQVWEKSDIDLNLIVHNISSEWFAYRAFSSRNSE